MASFNASLRNRTVKRALQTYIVPTFTKRYQVAAVRALWQSEDLNTEIWLKRLQLENILFDNSDVVAFFSSITGIRKKRNKRKHAECSESDTENEEEIQFEPGFAFWIVFDSPEFSTPSFEREITKSLLEAGLDISSCRAISGRGIIPFFNVF